MQSSTCAHCLCLMVLPLQLPGVSVWAQTSPQAYKAAAGSPPAFCHPGESAAIKGFTTDSLSCQTKAIKPSVALKAATVEHSRGRNVICLLEPELWSYLSAAASSQVDSGYDEPGPRSSAHAVQRRGQETAVWSAKSVSVSQASLCKPHL